jgi:hypothetical protein
METHPELKMFIIDVLQHDEIEQLTSIINMLNDNGCIGWRKFWPSGFNKKEVIETLKFMLQHEWVEVLDEDCQIKVGKWNLESVNWESVWFKCTTKGKQEWDSWTPPFTVSDTLSTL